MAFLIHPTVKIYCKAGPNFSVTIRNGQVVLAPANPTDEYQHWYKDDKAFPYFTLVNKKTGEAIKHAIGAHQTVQLVPYDPNVVDESILWTEGMDLCTGYKSIQMGKNSGLFFNACGGYASDGVSIIAYPWANGKENEVWKIEEYSTIRVYYKANTYTDFNITIREGNVVLAKSNLSDEFQHWYKEEKYSAIKDEEGYPSFALINKATGQALKHAVEANKPLQLVPYNPTEDVRAILWTEGKNLGNGYKAIRMATNINLTMNTCGGCADDGVSVILCPWSNGKTNEQWKIELFTPYVIPKETVKLSCKAKVELSISIRDGLVVLAPSNPTDEFQHWYKYTVNTINNDEVFLSFALVNQKTSQAIKHSAGARKPVQLIPFNLNVLDECILWTEGTDLSGDYLSIQMGNNTGMFFSVSGGYASDGVSIVTDPSEDGKDDVAWKIEQYTTVKVGCTVGTTDFNITIRDGSVVLAKFNLSDEFQHWYKEEKYNNIKDDQGYPSFALINRATGQALKRSVGANQGLQLVTYNATGVDESILWTECKNLGDAYNAILATNTNLVLDACGGYADDGVSIILHSWSNGENLKQWKIEPFTPYVLLKETVRLCCKVGPTFSLTIKDGKVVLSPSNAADEFQHWYKYNTMNDEGSPSFALVNKKSGLAIKHSAGVRGHVQLIHFNPNVLDESILWTEGTDMGDGYKGIQMGYNTGMFFNKQGGYTYDGVRIIVYPWGNGKSNEVWMIEKYTTNRIYCKAGADFNITIRDGNVVLAKSNLSDKFQHWYKNYSDKKDDEGCPSFALINKATGQALKHAVAAHEYVQLAPYNPANVEESILWTKGKDLGDGFKAIRMATNTSLTVNACYGDAADGVSIILYPWSNGKNNEQWKIEPFEFLER